VLELSTVTRRRTKARQSCPSQSKRRITKAFSTTLPGSSLQATGSSSKVLSPGAKNHHGFPPEVVQAPRRQPLPLGGPSTAGGWLDQKPGARFVLLLRQWEVPPAILLLSTSMSQYASSS